MLYRTFLSVIVTSVVAAANMLTVAVGPYHPAGATCVALCGSSNLLSGIALLQHCIVDEKKKLGFLLSSDSMLPSSGVCTVPYASCASHLVLEWLFISSMTADFLHAVLIQCRWAWLLFSVQKIPCILGDKGQLLSFWESLLFAIFSSFHPGLQTFQVC